jgi:hypothetical protein
MHKRLDQLLETEVGLVNEGEDQDEDQDEDNCTDFKYRPDIQVLTEKPHVIPYPSLQHISADIIEQYDPFKYPDHIKHLPHKRTWRGPEGLEGVTISRLLSKFEPLLPALLGPSGIETLGELTNCRISHNLQGSLCYIGTDQGPSALDAATRKLSTFASLMVIVITIPGYKSLTVPGFPFSHNLTSHLYREERASEGVLCLDNAYWPVKDDIC